MQQVQKVAIIGAGAAGLVAAAVLRRAGMSVTVFEQTRQCGGTWVYTSHGSGEASSNGTSLMSFGSAAWHVDPTNPSSMYKNLRTNLPKEIMAFTDYPFPDDAPSFMHHTQSYCELNNLSPLIKYNRRVRAVRRRIRGGWRLWVETTGDTSRSTVDVDAVLVCNGHYHIPYLPRIPGQDEFSGVLFHSHLYRVPEPFSGMRAIVVGDGPSGVDIAAELCGTAETVYLCSKRVEHSPDPAKHQAGSSLYCLKHRYPTLKEFSGEHSVVLTDGTVLHDVNVVVFCTGYRYWFPFLRDDDGAAIEAGEDEYGFAENCTFLDDDGEVLAQNPDSAARWKCGVRVTPHERIDALYEHVFSVNDPSLAFIGIPIRILPFPQFELQAKWICNVWRGSVALPSKRDMLQWITDDLRFRERSGIPRHLAHFLGDWQWRYNDHVAEMAGVEPLSPLVEMIYQAVRVERAKSPDGYKDRDMSAVVERLKEELNSRSHAQ